MKFKANGNIYEMDEKSITFAEGKALEKVSGVPFTGVAQAAVSGSLSALQGLIWIAVKRSDPGVKFDDLDDWAIDTIEFEDEGEENPTSAAE